MKVGKSLLAIVFQLFIVFGNMSCANAQQPKVRAPELNGGVDWLNTDKPISLQALRGKIVLLDFWTYGCINCMHIIPDLKKLEEKYPNQLVVIGVHSAKFSNESETANIRKIILRYELTHPVVNDSEFNIWNQYGIRAYPTLVLIDPNGYITNTFRGEGNAEQVDHSIEKMIAEFRKSGTLNERPLEFALERAKVGSLPLAFPGKVLADEKSRKLFVSDSNHNRIVVTDFSEKLIDVIGNGIAALKDGDYQNASFYRPQGLALDGENLYVADTENHAIRVVNLKTKSVTTIAGDGKQAAWRSIGGSAKTAELSSPWDLAKIGNNIFIAMAGTHQIWKFDLVNQTVAPFAGSGAEARQDGELSEAAFAQPSGIATDGKNLWVTDSESNVIRQIDLAKETVETLVGGDLYDFGDVDGRGDNVRLQHPLGIIYLNGTLLISDTYNHKIKTLQIDKRVVKTLIGTGKPGQIDGIHAQFYEPGGLSYADGKIFVADTNNQAIRVIDVTTNRVSTFKIEGLTSPVSLSQSDNSPNLKELSIEAQTIGIGQKSLLTFDISLPEGFALNTEAPNRFEITTDEAVNFVNAKGKFDQLPLQIPFTANRLGSTKITAKFVYYYCREDKTGECLIKTVKWQVPVTVAQQGNSAILLKN